MFIGITRIENQTPDEKVYLKDKFIVCVGHTPHVGHWVRPSYEAHLPDDKYLISHESFDSLVQDYEWENDKKQDFAIELVDHALDEGFKRLQKYNLGYDLR